MEKTENYQKVIDTIKEKYSKLSCLESIDEQILEYVDYGQMEEEDIASEYDWYECFGNNEAEDDIIGNEYIVNTSKRMGIELSIEEHSEMYDELMIYYLGR